MGWKINEGGIMKFEWQLIRSEWQETHRAKVHGGWLVKESSPSFFPILITICFVPDPNHKWGE